MNDKGYTLTTAIELWKRLMDKTGNPYSKYYGIPQQCFFCDAGYPVHNPGCIWIIAVELVKLDEKSELG